MTGAVHVAVPEDGLGNALEKAILRPWSLVGTMHSTWACRRPTGYQTLASTHSAWVQQDSRAATHPSGE